MWIGARIKEVFLRKQKFTPKGHEVAGRRAENDLARTVNAGISGSYWRAWEGLRIPNKDGHRREVDLIILANEEALLIEQKHWSGDVKMEGETVFQHRRSGDIMDHGEVFGKIKMKCGVLAWHHNVNDSLQVPMRPVVIFSNKNLNVPDYVAQREDCMTVAELIDYLPGGGGSVGTGFTPAQIALTSTLDELGSWDEIHQPGGNRIFGDVFAGLPEQGPVHDLLKNRFEDIKEINVKREMSIWKAIIKRPALDAEIINQNGAVMAVCAINPDSVIKHRPAGSRGSTEVKWRHVDKVVLTSRFVKNKH
ncbi:MAG: hypothetical protein CXT69_04330 [Methanobacteriota archaeon]|jgi:hypothetical protein|nr:MAG: hypothetical protein CXT69_04330 [Euryarchaeota archaeon]HIK78427.1 NERD domain-containing protein [Candidatus Poseidoniales archaeon]